MRERERKTCRELGGDAPVAFLKEAAGDTHFYCPCSSLSIAHANKLLIA
jgi:hypothetical protein